MTKEIPIAIFLASYPKRSSIGEMIEPPPMPKKPENSPPMEPAKSKMTLFFFVDLLTVGFLKNRIMEAMTKSV